MQGWQGTVRPPPLDRADAPIAVLVERVIFSSSDFLSPRDYVLPAHVFIMLLSPSIGAN